MRRRRRNAQPADPSPPAPAARLVVSDAELAALLDRVDGRPAREQDLEVAAAAGWVIDGTPAGVLADGLRALLSPVCELELQRGGRRGRGAADARAAALISPTAQSGTQQLVAIPTSFLPDALSRLNDLGPRPRVEPALRLVYAAGDLARILSVRDAELAADLAGADGADAASELVEGLREHWRVEARWAPAGDSSGHRAVEVIDTERGLWLVVSDGAEVALWPSTPTAVFRLLTTLLPGVEELAETGT